VRRVLLKVCGVTRAEDAQLAASLGVDMLGFNFWPGSRRHVTLEQARAICAQLPPGVERVGVFVNQPRALIEEVAAGVGLHRVQLHGDETPEACVGFTLPVIKALAVRERPRLEQLRAWPVSALLLDTPTQGFGGSGRTFPWEHVQGLSDALTLLLAGGLNAENVAAAIRAVQPHAVDVASGVEQAPGIKDPEKLARFVAAAREVSG
jgi:phosphoribosylanthranilate isomerase